MSQQRRHSDSNLESESLSLGKTTSTSSTTTTSATSGSGSGQQQEPNIILARSDGLTHDIITVYKSFSDATDVRKALDYQNLKSEQAKLTALRQNQQIPEHENDLDASAGASSSSNIILPRSDEEHHDIGKKYRSLTVPNLSNDIAQCGQYDVRKLQFVTGPVRIVHYSKTLDLLDPLLHHDMLPPGNILIHSGDFTRDGKVDDFIKFDSWLYSVAHLYPYRVVIFGQNETMKFNENWNEMKKLLPHATHILCDTTEVILGLRIHGCPYHKSTQTRKSFLPRMQHRSIYSDLQGIDVLVSYEPGYGKLDSTDYGESHAGNHDLHDLVKSCKPGVHLHGCVAASRGVLFPIGSRHPLTINSSMTDPEGKVLYASPHVVKATSLHVNEVGVKTWLFEVDSLFV